MFPGKGSMSGLGFYVRVFYVRVFYVRVRVLLQGSHQDVLRQDVLRQGVLRQGVLHQGVLRQRSMSGAGGLTLDGSMMTVGTKLRKMWLQSVRTVVLLKATSSSSMASSSSRSASLWRYSKEASCRGGGPHPSGPGLTQDQV